MLKNVLIFTAGALVGALAMHLYVVNTQVENEELTPEEQKEVDECHEIIENVIKNNKLKNEKSDEIINNMKETGTDYTSIVEKYNGEDKEAVDDPETNAMSSTLFNISQKGRETMTDIYEIDAELFDTTYEHYDKLLMEFYAVDKVIRDAGNPDDAVVDIEDILDMFGEEGKDRLFNLVPELNCEILYFRNERLKIDYCVDIINERFYDEEESEIYDY